MKYFKLFLTVCAMAVAISASAQSKTTAKSKTATSTTKTTTAAPAKKAATTTKKTATTTAKSTSSAKSTAKTATTSSPKTTTTTTTKAAKETSKPAKETTKTAKETTKAAKVASSASDDFDRRVHFMMETKIGAFFGPTGGWGENLVLEKEFHKYVAVDFFSIDYSTNFGFDVFDVGLKVGARGFSPRWWSGKMRAYGSLAMGYDCGITRAQDVWVDGAWVSVGSQTAHGFGLSWSAGVQIVDRVYVGYAMEYSTVWKSTAHFARIGVRF